MSEVFMVPDSCSKNNNNLDSALLMSMMNNNNGFNNGGWLWIIFLFFLEPLMRGGWGNNWGNNGMGNNGGLLNAVDATAGRELLQQAIAGNREAISQLSSMMSTSTEFIQQAICGVEKSISTLSGQVGLTGQQTINALQQGNMQLASQLSSCCCDIRESITRGNYENQIATLNQTNALTSAINGVSTGQERGFSSLGFTAEQNKCDIVNAIKDNTAQVLAGQRAAELRELQREITERDRKIAEQSVVINNGQQTAIFGQMINQATQPIVQAVNCLGKEVSDIQCKLPQTVTLPYSCATAVPTCLAAQYGLGYGSANFGFWG